MRVIWKYEVTPHPLGGHLSIEMPARGEPVSVQRQRNQIQLWMKVDPKSPMVNRKFKVIPTGFEFDDSGMAYIGTFQIEELEHNLVFHLFECLEEITKSHSSN